MELFRKNKLTKPVAKSNAAKGAAMGGFAGPVGAAIGGALGYALTKNRQGPTQQPKKATSSTSKPVSTTRSTSNTSGTQYQPYNAQSVQPQLTQSTTPPSGNFMLDVYTHPQNFPEIDETAIFNQEYNNLGSYYDPLFDYEKRKYNLQADEARNSFDNYLSDTEAKLAEDRNSLDVSAGRGNYAFSEGIRNNQRTKLQDSYNRDIASKRNSLESNMANNALNLEYQLGSNALNNMNFNLSTGSANAMSNSPSLVRSTNRAYNPAGNYAGRYNAERASAAKDTAIAKVGNMLSRRNSLRTNY